MADDRFIERIVLTIFLAVFFVLGFFLVRNMIIPIVLALILAYILQPFYKKINVKVKRRNLSTTILMLVILLVTIATAILLVPPMIEQTFGAYKEIQSVNLQSIVDTIFLNSISPETARAIAINLNNVIATLFSYSLNQFSAFLVNLPLLFVSLIVFTVTFYFSVRDAEELKKFVSNITPFSPETEKKLSKEFRNITNGVVYGQILVGILQGFLIGLGLFIIGVKAFIPLTFVAVIAAALPVVGSWIVWIPASIWLFFSGSPIMGFLFLAYSLVMALAIEGFLRSYFLSEKSGLPMIMSFIGIVGGIYAFGIVGLVIGPLIIAYGLLIIDFYRQGRLQELFRR